MAEQETRALGKHACELGKHLVEGDETRGHAVPQNLVVESRPDAEVCVPLQRAPWLLIWKNYDSTGGGIHFSVCLPTFLPWQFLENYLKLFLKQNDHLILDP